MGVEGSRIVGCSNVRFLDGRVVRSCCKVLIQTVDYDPIIKSQLASRNRLYSLMW
jgi:hypothetical protein